MRAAFLVPSKGRHASLSRCLPSIARAAAAVAAPVIVCDQSPQPFAVAGPWRVVHRPDLGGLPAARNALLDLAGDADLVCFCDDDVLLGADFAEVLVACAQREVHLDGWGPVVETRPRWLRRAHRLLQLGAIRDPRRLLGRRVDAPTDALFGCCFAVRTACARRMGFDERLAGYALGEDLDFCRRLRRAGHRLRFCRDLCCVHLEDGAGRADPRRRGLAKARLLRRLARDGGPRDPAGLVHLALGLLAAASGGGRSRASLSGVIAGLCARSPYDPGPVRS